MDPASTNHGGTDHGARGQSGRGRGRGRGHGRGRQAQPAQPAQLAQGSSPGGAPKPNPLHGRSGQARTPEVHPATTDALDGNHGGGDDAEPLQNGVDTIGSARGGYRGGRSRGRGRGRGGRTRGRGHGRGGNGVFESVPHAEDTAAGTNQDCEREHPIAETPLISQNGVASENTSRGRGRRGGRGSGRRSGEQHGRPAPKVGSPSSGVVSADANAVPLHASSNTGADEIRGHPEKPTDATHDLDGTATSATAGFRIANGQGIAHEGHEASRTSSTTKADMTKTRFSDLGLVEPLMRAVREAFRYEWTTKVQAESIPISSAGADVLVKAKTGTGKTLAFLLPVYDRLIRMQDADRPSGYVHSANGGRRISGKHIDVLVISPTRELASQIADEARMVLRFAPQFHVQTVIGGTNIRADVTSFKKKGMPSLLVATPGRLIDHLENSEVNLSEGLSNLGALVLDEADRLLDMGFRPALEKVLGQLPPTSARQTLLFSATMPEDVRGITVLALKKEHRTVDCVGEGANTHERVPQFVLVTRLEDQIAALACCLADAIRLENYKVIVFFTTARLTQFFAELFDKMGRPVLEMHSRKSQGHRNKVSDKFRNSDKLIMFSSDVTARGLDFPDVTSIIQVGLPSDRAQYVHRLGRTARAGKAGSGVLLLSEFEAPAFLPQLSDLPLQQVSLPPRAMMDEFKAAGAAACRELPPITKTFAYQAWLGFYNSHLRGIGWTKETLVQMANAWITSVVGEPQPPELPLKTVRKMGLANVPGIRVEPRNAASKGGRGPHGPGRGAGGGDTRTLGGNQHFRGSSGNSTSGRGRRTS